uniref:RING-type domain-containing protein n=1 Tax=Panagrolaimus superbus TaxID=310955 RepID=A0A914Z000_9BILA
MDSASAPAPYFCFKCNKYLHPEHVLDYQCRFCNTGFIEEVHPGINNLTDDDSPNNSNSSENGVNLGQLLGMLMGGSNGGGGVVIGGNTAGGNRTNNSQRQGSGSPPDPASRPQNGNGNATNFIQSTLMPAFIQAMSGNNAPASGQNSSNRRSASSGPSNSRRQGAGRDRDEQPQQNQGGGFFEELLRNLAPANTSIRIQFGNGGVNIGNVNLGDFATDAGFDEIVSQILNQFDPAANTQRISEEDLQHLPRSKVTQAHVDNEAQCTTCMDQFNLNEEVGELGCHHIFHPDCIIPWLRSHNTCPVCRQQVNPESWRQNPANPVPPEQKEGFRDGDELD